MAAVTTKRCTAVLNAPSLTRTSRARSNQPGKQCETYSRRGHAVDADNPPRMTRRLPRYASRAGRGYALSGLTRNEFIEPRHAQANRHRGAALVLPIPAVDALPRRDQRAVRLRAGRLLVEHQIAGLPGRG